VLFIFANRCKNILKMRETVMQAALTRPDDPWALEIKGHLRVCY